MAREWTVKVEAETGVKVTWIKDEERVKLLPKVLEGGGTYYCPKCGSKSLFFDYDLRIWKCAWKDCFFKTE